MGVHPHQPRCPVASALLTADVVKATITCCARHKRLFNVLSLPEYLEADAFDPRQMEGGELSEVRFAS